MSKQITKLILDGKPIGTKPLFLNDNLPTIREKIKDKITNQYIFLDQDGNTIDKNDEKDYKLEDISKEKMIQLKSEGNDGTGIDIFLNDSKICSLNCSKSQSLNEVRSLLNNSIKGDFTFLDPDSNTVSKDDEKDYSVEDILSNGAIKLKGNDSPAATPFNESNNEKKPETKKAVKKKKIDFSGYEIVEKRDDLTTYRPSNIKQKSNHKLVYNYQIEEYGVNDYRDAYVILFCGKTGDGKTTAINAFYNIVKGVELEDNYRFILITEPKKEKGQAESQTDGVHLYYIRDYENKPVIIIDSQGYGDTRGTMYDEMVNEAFRFVFSEVIDHINAAFFIVKTNTNRIDILTKYIFSSVTCLFAEDISENFIILATFANKETINKGPAFVESIKTDADFLKINERMNDNWWYAIDSKSIMDNENDKLTKYSFEKANELYNVKVKKLRRKGIKKSAEVLNTRMELKVQVENLNDTFKNLLVEQDNLQEKDKSITITSEKIKMMEDKIKDLEKMEKSLNPKELQEKIRQLNVELNDKLISLNNQTETRQIKKLAYFDGKCTHCGSCEKNCHEECDCAFGFLGRCHIFTFWAKKCEICGCDKERHKQDNLHYIYETIVTTKSSDEERQKEVERNEAEKRMILEEMNKKNNAKNEFERQKNELQYNKGQLMKEKENNLKEKEDIKNKINVINKQILFIIIKLQTISEKLSDIAMSTNHIKTEDEYIDDLIEKMDKMNIKEKDKIQKLKTIKETNDIFKKTVKMDRNELMKLDDSQLAEKLKIIIPKCKKDNPGDASKENADDEQNKPNEKK